LRKENVIIFRDILLNLYNDNPRLFISRYFTYLVPEDCSLFDEQDYDIAPYIKRINKNMENSNTEKVRRNVRFAELERLKKETDYFSYPKMREREPLLFDKMIGRFLPEEEQVYLRPTIENESLSGLLLQFQESEIVSNRLKKQLEDDVLGLKSNSSEELSKLRKLALHASCRETSADVMQQELEGQMQSLSIKPEDPCISSEIKSKSVEMSTEEPNTDNVIDGEEGEEMIDDDQEQMKSDFIDFMEQKFLLAPIHGSQEWTFVCALRLWEGGKKDGEFFDYGALYNQKNFKEFDRIYDQDSEDAYFADDQ
uniref:DUF2052 domain-containing protein n=1 Tax=Syphacia muris TaxID=451379 RepID=A0A0N5ABY7_9BILA